jgi:D-alanyl-D-alanine carboxypeptidase/D-alanyl-D-alanine-endopeptidase (penicillin-binding protein 4)
MRCLIWLWVFAASWGGLSPAQAQTLPASIRQALQKAQLPETALHVYVAPVQVGQAPLLAHQASVPANPASTAKLVTTFAALDLLGPAHVWTTLLATDGTLQPNGLLQGNLYIKGQGDPKMVTERLWLLLQQVQSAGVRQIQGDLVLDRSAFADTGVDPAAFDGEPLKPYNAVASALLVNYQSQLFRFVPDENQSVAHVSLQPPLAGVNVPAQVPLRPNTSASACADWRGQLQADFSNPLGPVFLGSYPTGCGERWWPIAHSQPDRFALRAVEGMWRHMGGVLQGQVRWGQVPAQHTPRGVFESPPLAEVVRDVNKFSNNVMAQHVFLALAQQRFPNQPAHPNAAREALLAWWQQRMGPQVAPPQLDNGSGLSRDARISAQSLGAMLQVAYASPVMPELVASLPVNGRDGTLRRRSTSAAAHLKTGSLRDVQAIAGYVHAPSGERKVLVAIVNHPNAGAARPVMDALVEWAAAQP